MRTLTATLALGAILGAATAAMAAEYNQPRHLDVGARVKIDTTIVKTRSIRKDVREQAEDGIPKCGEERNGVIVDRRLDGQSVIVVTEDIINNGGNVSIGRECR